jgi:HTH-type transcriptional regulator / antitoxin HigA
VNDESVKTPGERIRDELNLRGWTQADLAQIVGKTVAAVNEVIQGKRGITTEMAIALSQAFGTEPDMWLHLDAIHRLSQTSNIGDEISQRAKMFNLAPVKDMQRRGWLSKTKSIKELERELCCFFEVDSLDREPRIDANTRRTDRSVGMNSSQRAWCFRAKQLSKLVEAAPYSSRSLNRAARDLRKLAAWPEELRKLHRVLEDCGIRFVVVEPLPHTRIDGAAFWLDESKPVIAVSLRYDRIDSFLHTIGHELSHIRHRDGAMLDSDIVGTERPSPAEQDSIELRADREAAATWIETEVIDDFVARIGPLYSREKINQFANRIRIHPGIIVGQLQHRGEISYGAMAPTLEKIRSIVTSETLTDGWGHSVDVRL